MRKIGIILKSTECDKYLYQNIRELINNNKIELFFLLNNQKEEKKSIYQKYISLIKNRGLYYFISLLIFKIVTILEFKFLSLPLRNIREHYNIIKDINGLIDNNLLYLNPNFSKSGLFVTYPLEDIEKIKALKLDLIIRGNAEGIFRGDILNSSKDGIISFHYGDNMLNRGEPAGFWEVYYKKDTTKFIIQILSEELSSGDVLFHSNITTKNSYIENVVYLYQESYSYMLKILNEYANSGNLPKAKESIPYSGTILKLPTAIESTIYAIKTFSIYFTFFIKKYILKRQDRWSVAFIKKSWDRAILREGIEIKNPKNRFFADPFIITKDNRTVCFVEDYSYDTKIGSISAIEIFDNNQYKIYEYIIKEPFHMSFPYIFSYKDELYMVPETSKAKSIRLYKCIDFPTKWEYQKELFKDISAADSMIFYHNSMWWIFFTTSLIGKNHNSHLVAYYTDDPINGKWTPHKKNPLINNSTIARNGGIVGLDKGIVIRARQRQSFNSYGGSLSLAEITELTPELFSEKEICKILPNFLSDIKGTHQIHSNKEYTVYDYLRNRRLE